MISPVRSRVSMSGGSPVGRTGERLLAQDVLAGLQGADAPLDVQMVRERDVDRLDLRVREQRLVASMGDGNPRGSGSVGGAAGIARGDRPHVAQVARVHGRNHAFERDPRCAEYSPDDRCHTCPPRRAGAAGRRTPSSANSDTSPRQISNAREQRRWQLRQATRISRCAESVSPGTDTVNPTSVIMDDTRERVRIRAIPGDSGECIGERGGPATIPETDSTLPHWS